jgi:uncharacterized damage-inducible protein DinB
MAMTALFADELSAWVEHVAAGYFVLLGEHPEALSLPCDILSVETVGQLMQHIVAVQLRYAQRIQGLAETAYEDIPFGSASELQATHARGMDMLRQAVQSEQIDWEEPIAFSTRSAGTLQASRRTILVHALMHSIRHYAQLATLLRQHGLRLPWPSDYLFMQATASL